MYADHMSLAVCLDLHLYFELRNNSNFFELSATHYCYVSLCINDSIHGDSLDFEFDTMRMIMTTLVFHSYLVEC